MRLGGREITFVRDRLAIRGQSLVPWCCLFIVMIMSSIKISYTICPPSSVKPTTPDLVESKSTEYQISPTGIPLEQDKGGKAYYRELKKTLEAARMGVGEELTRWRDFIGKAELKKEPPKDDDNDDDDDVGNRMAIKLLISAKILRRKKEKN